MEPIKGNYKTLAENPGYFGAYLNLARINVLNIFNEIHKKFGVKEIANADDEKLKTSFLLDATLIKKNQYESKIISELERYFPFLRNVMLNVWCKRNRIPLGAEKDLVKAYTEILQELIDFIFELRNKYSHADEGNDVTITRDHKYIVALLSGVYDAALRGVKENLPDPSAIRHLERIDGKTKKEKKGFTYALFEKKTPGFFFTEKGIALFCCLFLERKDGFLLLKKIRGFKGGKETWEKATLELFTFYKARLPKPRFESAPDEQSLLLDIINELKRCPGTLFEHLDKHHQAAFMAAPDEDAEDADMPLTPQTRKNSRFVSLALRYLETQEEFKDIQFLIDLGTYFHKVYPKHTLEMTVARRLDEKLFVFGHLKDFTRENRPYPADMVKMALPDGQMPESMKPYVVDTTPRYFIEENGVGIKIGNGTTDWPKLELDKLLRVTQPEDKDYDVAWLSEYEVSSMLFNEFLHQFYGSKSKNKNIIEGYVKRFKSLLNKLQDFDSFRAKAEASKGFTNLLDYTLSNCNIASKYELPDKLRLFLEGIEPENRAEKAMLRIETMIQDGDDLLKKLRNEIENVPKIGKKGEKVLKQGKYAEWLAKDMMLFQPSLQGGKDKANDTQYRILQQRLAYYGRDKALLEDTFKELNLLASPNAHPFLSKVPVSLKGFFIFIQDYIKARKTYLESCLKDPENANYNFIKLTKSSSEAGWVQEYCAHLSKMPINLPRGIFNDSIKAILQKNGVLTDTLQTERVNTAYLMQQFLKQVLHDDCQGFYNWPRHYEFIDKLEDRRGARSRASLELRYKTPDELQANFKAWKAQVVKLEAEGDLKASKWRTMFNLYEQAEKEIRLYKTEDIGLYFMASTIMAKVFTKDLKTQILPHLKLKDAMPNTPDGKSILSQKIDFEYALSGTAKTIRQNGLKFKNMGDFRAIILDKRLNSMLPYFTKKVIDKQLVLQELDAYNRFRPEIMEAAINIEQLIAKYYPDKLNTRLLSMGEAEKDAKHRLVYMALVEELFPAFKADIDLAVKIRNEFSHSKYPSQTLFPDIEYKPGCYISEQFRDKLLGIYKQWQTRMEQDALK